MYIQRNCKTVVGYFRANRKCVSFNGSLLFILILIAGIVQQSAARLSEEKDSPHHFDVGNDSGDVDNSEIQRGKMVDGVPQQDHPIIIYKEDFVSDDYVLPKNATKSEKHKRHYKNVAHRQRHTKENFTDVVIEEKSGKTLFDIIPDKPLIMPEDMEIHGKSDMKLVPLIKDITEMNETDKEESTLKEALQKRPKKYHHRVRRSTNGDHSLYKRNPYFRLPQTIAGEVSPQVQYTYVKHPVAGKKHNGLDIPVPIPRRPPTSSSNDNVPISFDNRIAADENDRVIFASYPRTQPRTTERPESIFRDPRPENFDFSFMNPARLTTTTARTPIFNRRPETPKQEESIFRDPRPENFDFSFMNPQAQQSSFKPAAVPTPARSTTSSPQTSTQPPISPCVWAIVHCCTGDTPTIRYDCFEIHGCYGAFWGVNPCADTVKNRVIKYVAKYYS